MSHNFHRLFKDLVGRPGKTNSGADLSRDGGRGREQMWPKRVSRRGGGGGGGSTRRRTSARRCLSGKKRSSNAPVRVERGEGRSTPPPQPHAHHAHFDRFWRKENIKPLSGIRRSTVSRAEARGIARALSTLVVEREGRE